MVKKRKKSKEKNNTLMYASMTLISIALAMFCAFKLYLYSLPPISNFDSIKPNPVTSIYSSDGQLIKTFTVFKFEKVSLEDVPADLKNAFIATEDKNFYKHEGYDLFGLLRSIVVNVTSGRVKQGASTITQQLARILFLSNERTFTRKIKELIIAHRIEKTIPKNRILEMYLNAVYLGSGSYGVVSAAQTYFDKDLDELTLAEKALIAGLPQAPSIYSPLQNPDKAVKRRNWVLKRMYKTGYITKEQYKKALEEKLHLNKKPRIYSYNKAPYFVDYVLAEMEKLGFDEQEISQGGLKIYTTIDYDSQIKAQDAVSNNLKSAGLVKDKSQGSLFSFSPTTGKIYAYVGGKNYEKSQYDRVTNAIRPPGSSFKPFVYAAAIQQGYNPMDIMDDHPIEINDWAPKNYGGKYRGKIPMWLALAVSSNVCAVQLIQKVGVGTVINFAKEMGITTPLQYDMTIALGSNGVKLYDMVIAYGAFANGGFRVQPYSVERVENSRGVTMYEHSGPKIAKVISFDTASAMTFMLKKVIQVGTGRAANIGKEAAGKTGTTDDYRDAWFMGYTPDLVTGVWIGNDDNTKLGGSFTGGGVPARIWRDYMKVATSKFPKSVFDYPQIQDSTHTQVTEEPQETVEEENYETKGSETIDETNNTLSTKPPMPAVSKPQNEGPKSPFVATPPKTNTAPLPMGGN
jgi:penicillin-binding protein 1A